MSLRAELKRLGQLRGVSISDVDALLAMDWQALWDDLPATPRGEAKSLHQFLKGMRHEFEEGYWDGGADEDMGSRIRRFTATTDG